MKTNSIRVMTVLAAMTMLMTSCDDGGYLVIPIWVVVLIIVCFFCR